MPFDQASQGHANNELGLAAFDDEVIVAELSFQLPCIFCESVAYAYPQPFRLVYPSLIGQDIAVSAPNSFEGSHCSLLKLHNSRFMRVPEEDVIPIIISLFFFDADLRRLSWYQNRRVLWFQITSFYLFCLTCMD